VIIIQYGVRIGARARSLHFEKQKTAGALFLMWLVFLMQLMRDRVTIQIQNWSCRMSHPCVPWNMSQQGPCQLHFTGSLAHWFTGSLLTTVHVTRLRIAATCTHRSTDLPEVSMHRHFGFFNDARTCVLQTVLQYVCVLYGNFWTGVQGDRLAPCSSYHHYPNS
jgi:hypothetical protein